MERKTKKATPAHFKIAKAIGEVAKIADKPIADIAPQIINPPEFPTTE
jgi:hypothetical protein